MFHSRIIKPAWAAGFKTTIYRAVNIFTRKSYAIKLELSLDGESSVEEASYDGLVIDLLSVSIHQLIGKHRRFHIHTVGHLVEQLISRLHCIHSHGYIHGNIKPQNILMGLGDNPRTIFVVDFGIAKQYCDPITGNHLPFVHADHLTGTPTFTSINSHLGARLGHRDDVESLAYLLIYLSSRSLPWIADTHPPSILELKQNSPVKQLCKEPDYDYLRLLCMTLYPEPSNPSVILHDLSLHEDTHSTSNMSSSPLPPDVRHQDLTGCDTQS
ncbi:kinase-like protein [Imleria badia]|nr:kinase-like protein [Imleria badia]